MCIVLAIDERTRIQSKGSMFSRHVKIFLLVAVLCANSSYGQNPRLLSSAHNAPPVWGVIESPKSSGRHPGVVILHGSFGWRSNYAELAKVLADSGFVALAIDYYARDRNDTVPAPPHGNWDDLQATVQSAVDYLQSLPSASGRVGLIGFSRGAFLAVSIASSIPVVRGIVDFYGGVWAKDPSINKQLSNFPPLLILHGEADTLAPVKFAYELKELVVARGGEVEMNLYPNAPHSFFSNFISGSTDSTISDALSRTVRFLRARLQE